MTTAVIFGAGGIATASAAELCGRGFTRFYILSRGASDAGAAMERQLTQLGAEARVVPCDVTDWSATAEACASIPGPVHGVVYAPGARFTATPDALDQHAWRHAVDLYAGGLVGALVALENKLAYGATVVALSGTSARRIVSGGHLAMGSAKAAMERAVAYLAYWLARRNVRVNGVCCGAVDTPTVRESLSELEFEQLQENLAKQTLAGRLATPEDIAAIVAWLSGADSRWIYGQVILADGGEDLLRG